MFFSLNNSVIYDIVMFLDWREHYRMWKYIYTEKRSPSFISYLIWFNFPPIVYPTPISLHSNGKTLTYLQTFLLDLTELLRSATKIKGLENYNLCGSCSVSLKNTVFFCQTSKSQNRMISGFRTLVKSQNVWWVLWNVIMEMRF